DREPALLHRLSMGGHRERVVIGYREEGVTVIAVPTIHLVGGSIAVALRRVRMEVATLEDRHVQRVSKPRQARARSHLGARAYTCGRWRRIRSRHLAPRTPERAHTEQHANRAIQVRGAHDRLFQHTRSPVPTFGLVRCATSALRRCRSPCARTSDKPWVV